MNKLKHIVLLIAILLFPIIVNAEGNISITKIEKKDITGYAYEVNPPTFKGLDVSYDLSFHQVGDSVTYIATVQNSDKESYKIANKNSFSPSGYMTYEFKFTDNTNVIKSNETKEMYITIKYNKEVPIEKLVNGEYKEQNQMNLVLVNNNGQIPNPNTNSTILFILLICSLLIISIVLFKKHKKVSVLLLALSLLIPATAYALKEIKINLNTQVIIEKDLKFCIYDTNAEISPQSEKMPELEKTYFKYTDGETIENWMNNNSDIAYDYFEPEEYFSERVFFYKNGYTTCINNVLDKYQVRYSDIFVTQIDLIATNKPAQYKKIVESHIVGHGIDNDEMYDELNKCEDDYIESTNITNKIKRSSEGCYYVVKALT